MTNPQSFDDILDAALDRLRAGQPISAILASYPSHAQTLRSLLEAASMGLAASAPPPVDSLDAKFSVVQAALDGARRAQFATSEKRVQWSRRNAISGAILAATRRFSELWEKRVQWAPRRLAFASLSLPAFALAAIVVAGTSGAAAAALVVEQPHFARTVADAVTPDWVIEIRSDGPGDEVGSPPASVVETPASSPAGAFEPTATAAVPGSKATEVAGGRTPGSNAPGNGETHTNTPNGSNATPVPHGNSDHTQTPSHGTDDGSGETNTSPGNSGEDAGHDSPPPPNDTAEPDPTKTPGKGSDGSSNGDGDGNGRPATSTPGAAGGHSHSSDADEDQEDTGNNGKGGGKADG